MPTGAASGRIATAALLGVFAGGLAHAGGAQVTDTSHQASVIMVSGMVRDSIAGKPLADATVQLVGVEGQASFARTATSDASGIYSIADVPDGRYMVGFFHPILDSLGVEPPLTEVRIEGQKPVRIDLATPSARKLRTVICGAKARSDSSGLVVGTVRDARTGDPMPRVSVFGEWLELSFMRGGIVRRAPRLVAVTGDNGWFAMCNVPSGGTMTLMASMGADSTDVIEVQVPPTGFVRRELYLGPARTVVIQDTAQRSDTAQRTETTMRAPRRLHYGNGVLTGTVVAAVGNRPLGGALVGIVDGPRVRANERGEFTLADAPAGSRMLEVRAVGYYPDRRRVDVIAGAPPVRVALSTLQAVLDTVRVIASSVRTRDLQGFLERRRTGLGHYLTADDLARRGARNTSDAFRSVPGVHVERTPLGDDVILMRSGFGECSPAVYINGMYMNLGPQDIDDWVRPKEVIGIEVYTEERVPPQFTRGMSGCGSIVIWTR